MRRRARTPSRGASERKRIGKEFRTLFNLMPDLVAIVDGKGKILAVNDAAEKLGGFKRRELVGRNFLNTNVFTPESKAIMVQNLARRMMGMQIAPYEVELVTKGGEKKWGEVNATRIEYKGRPASITVFRDVTDRKRIEEQLRESEEKYRALMDDAPIGVCNVDLNGTIAFVNKRFEEVSGYSRIEVVGKSGFELGMFSDETLKIFAERMRAILEGEATHPLDTRFKCGDGRWIWVEIEGRAIKEQGVPIGFQLISREITERKQMEEELRQYSERLEQLVEERAHELKKSEEKYRLLVNNMMDVVFTIDLKGNFTFCSQAVEKMIGYSVQQLLSMNMKELIVPEHFPEIQERLQARIRGEGYLPPHQFEIVRADGKRLPVEMSTAPLVEKGTLIGIQGIARDISERRRTEDDLRESEEKFRRVCDASLDAIYTASVDGKILDMNPAGTSMFGFDSLDELRKVNIQSLYVNPDDRKRLIDLARKGPVRDFDVLLRRKDGGAINCIMNSYPIMDEEGRIVALQGAIIDITELRQMEKKLREAERLATIGETTAMVGHDLRNPLQAIIGAIYLAKMKYENLIPVHKELAQKSGVVELLDKIDEQVNYINKIISDLHDYASPMQPQLNETSIPDLVDDTISSITVPESVRFSVKAEKGFPKLMVDPALMRRVFTNLIMNALQAMPHGGHLTIKMSEADGAATIGFRDTGVGIPEENMEKLFVPLFTTKAKGQGFGLAVCKRLVEAHNGTIVVESKVGEGSTFTIKLPLKKER